MGGEDQQRSVTVFLASSELYNPTTDVWTPGPDMPNARAGFTATVLHDGRVLVAGGLNSSGYLANADIYDPASNSWTSAANMANARGAQTATLLPSGQVLVAGGFGAAGALSSCEIYDPVANSWSPAASLLTARGDDVAALLPGGKVLVAGGLGSNGTLNSSEIYDPTQDQWSSGGLMTTARSNETATTLPDGTVLVAGGDSGSGSLASTEVYHPDTTFWSLTGSMSVPRERFIAVQLLDGSVLAAGGESVSGGVTTPLADAEVYDPDSGSWSGVGSLSIGRFDLAASLLADGRVLAAGGLGPSGYLTNVDIYSPPAAPATTTPTSAPPTDTPIPPTETSTPPPTSTPIPVTDTPTATSTLVPSTTTPTPVPLDFQILAVRVSKRTDQPDWSLTHPSLSTVPVNMPLEVSLYANFASVPDNSQVTTTLDVTQNGQSVRRSGSLSKVDSGNTGDTWNHATFIPRVAGTYVLTGIVTVNGVTHRKSVSFTASARPVHTYPVSFTFSRLQSFGPNGRPATSFVVGKRVTLRAFFSVSNVANSVPVTVANTLQDRVSNGWRPLGQPVQNGFAAANGSQTFTFSFVPLTAYSALRVAVGMTIAGRTRVRAVTIQVHP
ncbi:MAG: hypothetical protein M3Z66_21245 [Chloroflexota bacterium]|nr:hypothetical protein [Chloroflexota bacterium]